MKGCAAFGAPCLKTALHVKRPLSGGRKSHLALCDDLSSLRKFSSTDVTRVSPITDNAQDGTSAKGSSLFRYIARKRDLKSDERKTPQISFRDELDLPESPIVKRVQKGPLPKKKHAQGKDAARLAQDMFANILASPQRICAATQVRLPRDLLNRYNVVKHPKEDAKHYLLPLDLSIMNRFRYWEGKETKSGSQQHTDPKSPVHIEQEGAVKSSSEPEKTRRLRYKSVYLQDRESLMQHIKITLNKKRKTLVDVPLQSGHLIPQKLGQQIPTLRSTTFWKVDMHELLLRLLRKRIVMGFENIFQLQKKGYGPDMFVTLAKAQDDEAQPNGDILHGSHQGALLWLGQKPAEAEDYTALEANFSRTNDDGTQRSTYEVFQPAKTYIQMLRMPNGRSLPILDIPAILQQDVSTLPLPARSALQEILEMLPADEGQSAGPWWVLRNFHTATQLLLPELWRLYRYSAHDQGLEAQGMYERRHDQDAKSVAELTEAFEREIRAGLVDHT